MNCTKEKLPIRTEADIYFHVRHLNMQRQKSGLPWLHLIGKPRVRKEKISPENTRNSSTDSSISVIVISDTTPDSSSDKGSISDSGSPSTAGTAKRRPPPGCGKRSSTRKFSSRRRRQIRSSSEKPFRGKRRVLSSSEDTQ